MKTFLEYLLEDVKFAAGQNVNYQAMNGKDNSVIFLSKETKKNYQERGQRSHGKESHAIKHYGEFNTTKYMALAGEVKAAIKDMLDQGQLDYIELHSSNGSVTNPDKVLKQARATSFLNALDAVQDMDMERKSLTGPERKLMSFARKLGSLYSSEIEERLRDAVDLDKIEDKEELGNILKTRKVIKFGVWRNRVPLYIYLDLKDNVVIITRGSTVATAFEFDTPASDYKGVIKNFMAKMGNRSGTELDNHSLYGVMAKI